MKMILKLNSFLLIVFCFFISSIYAQDVVSSSAESKGKISVELSNWIPLNAYSMAPSSNKDNLELSAMPVNWACGISVGLDEVRFIRLSLIANWRVEFEVKPEGESMSLANAGIGGVIDYGGLFYAGAVFPIELSSFSARTPQILVGVNLISGS